MYLIHINILYIKNNNQREHFIVVMTPRIILTVKYYFYTYQWRKKISFKAFRLCLLCPIQDACIDFICYIEEMSKIELYQSLSRWKIYWFRINGILYHVKNENSVNHKKLNNGSVFFPARFCQLKCWVMLPVYIQNVDVCWR